MLTPLRPSALTNAGCRGLAETEWIADCDDVVADGELARVAYREIREARVIDGDAQQCDIGAGVAVSERGGELTPVAEGDNDAVGTLHDVMVRYDQPFVAVDNDTRADALARYRERCASGPGRNDAFRGGTNLAAEQLFTERAGEPNER